MKLLILGVALAWQVFAVHPEGLCQQTQPDRPYLAHTDAPRLHFSAPLTAQSPGHVELSASSAQLDPGAGLNLSSANIQYVLRLKGNVEVRMCAPGGLGCEKGSMLLHADTVDYDEKTGALDAHGDVHIEPFRAQPQGATIRR